METTVQNWGVRGFGFFAVPNGEKFFGHVSGFRRLFIVAETRELDEGGVSIMLKSAYLPTDCPEIEVGAEVEILEEAVGEKGKVAKEWTVPEPGRESAIQKFLANLPIHRVSVSGEVILESNHSEALDDAWKWLRRVGGSAIEVASPVQRIFLPGQDEPVAEGSPAEIDSAWEIGLGKISGARRESAMGNWQSCSSNVGRFATELFKHWLDTYFFVPRPAVQKCSSKVAPKNGNGNGKWHGGSVNNRLTLPSGVKVAVAPELVQPDCELEEVSAESELAAPEVESMMVSAN